MAARFPCPNCATLRSSAAAVCEQCGYPRHARQDGEAVASVRRTRDRFQFRISTLLVCTTVAAIVFAAGKKWGVEGFLERAAVALMLASIPAPLVEFLYRFQKHYRNV